MIKLRANLLVCWVRIRKNNLCRRFWLYKALDPKKAESPPLAVQSLFLEDRQGRDRGGF